MVETNKDYTHIRVSWLTVDRLRKHKPYPEMSDDKLLNQILDRLEAHTKKGAKPCES